MTEEGDTRSVFDQVFDVVSEPGGKYTQGSCMDCEAAIEIDPLAIAAAFSFKHVLAKRGHKPLTNKDICRCDPCSDKWIARQQEISRNRLAEAAQLFKRMREIKGAGGDESAVEAFENSLPHWFRSDHGPAYHSYKNACSEIRAKLEEGRR